jgi:amino acid transporter
VAADVTGQPQTGHGFSTFKGVYTPSLLTILGVVMYLRFGWVLGNLGLFWTLVVVTLSTSITFLTALSISAIATNMRVGGGGAYYMISRSLGLEVGAAIGLPLFLAQALGISFYIAGFAESVTSLAPSLDMTIVGLVSLVALTALSVKSADLTLRSQYAILALIIISLVSFFAGGSPTLSPDIAATPLPEKESFWVVFAVFFPAVTGIEAGISLSGDLKDPAKSLPRGTLGAVITGYLVYMALPIFLSTVVHDERVLLLDPLVMREVAYWGDSIMLGLWGASLSSAVGALLGAPRTLQALARDGIVPAFLGRGHGPGDEPRVATGVAFLVAVAGIVAGGLNVIGPVLSMFFLTSYALLNVSAAFEALIGSPSWRPTYKTPWWCAALGAVACVATMLMINSGATFVAFAVSGAVYFATARRNLKASWGDLRHGILVLGLRFVLGRLQRSSPDARTWTPHLLVLSGSPNSRWHLMDFARTLTHGGGLITAAAIAVRETHEVERLDSNAIRHLQRMEDNMVHTLRERGVDAMVRVQAAANLLEGARTLIEGYGLGVVRPNTVLVGASTRPDRYEEHARLLEIVHRQRRNLVLFREGYAFVGHRGDNLGFDLARSILGVGGAKVARIDVWWSRHADNAGLLLSLAWLLSENPLFRPSQLVLKTIVFDEADKAAAAERLAEVATSGRITADVEVVVVNQGGDPFDTIREASSDAAAVFLGMRAPREGETIEEWTSYYVKMMERTEGLPPTALVLAAESVAFGKIFAPDDAS